jgi:hypothetical protein
MAWKNKRFVRSWQKIEWQSSLFKDRSAEESERMSALASEHVRDPIGMSFRRACRALGISCFISHWAGHQRIFCADLLWSPRIDMHKSGQLR